MKKINPKSKVIILAAMTVIGIAAIWALNSRVSARSMQCRTCRAVFSFGTLGITAQQTARFSVVNTRNCDQSHPCSSAQVELRFVNSSGAPVTNSDGYPLGSSTVSLASGQSAFVDFTPPSYTAGRTQIRAEVASCVDCGDSKGTVLATLEVFDTATGKTTLVMPNAPAISSHGDGDDE
jgi:hypothetical protein